MRKHALGVIAMGAVLALAPAVWAQSVISAKSGTIHHVDGKASIAGTNLKPTKTGEFPALEQGQTLVTQDAHAEVLLTPGVFLRLASRPKPLPTSNRSSGTPATTATPMRRSCSGTTGSRLHPGSLPAMFTRRDAISTSPR